MVIVRLSREEAIRKFGSDTVNELWMTEKEYFETYIKEDINKRKGE